jgi:hypothetical protein
MVDLGTSSKPKIFISSTVYDLGDLRGAIKYWLEESGYQVLASEFNDFQKDVALNSYEACLQAIDDCQYFILLIGSRAGGRVSTPPNTSITMLEYRHAYERAKQGKVKILALVRSAVWTVLEDRKALGDLVKSEYQKEHNLTDVDIEKLTRHKSKIVEDADLIFSFVNEVRRNEEMKAATKQAGALLPVNNWIHPFGGFRDVIDVLRTAFVRIPSIRRATLLANLQHEIAINLTALLERGDDGVLSPQYAWAGPARRQFSGTADGTSSIRGVDLLGLAIFAITASNGARLITRALDEAIVSGEFLDYDIDDHRYKVGQVQEALIMLRSSVESIRTISHILTNEKRIDLANRFREYKDNKSQTLVDNLLVGPAIILHDVSSDTVKLSMALLKWIYAGAFDAPALAPQTPFQGEEAQIRSERPTAEAILQAIQLSRV